MTRDKAENQNKREEEMKTKRLVRLRGWQFVDAKQECTNWTVIYGRVGGNSHSGFKTRHQHNYCWKI